jgi:8-oxo-dGTP pyrophosphatase MutT (NUDIX family)
MGDTVELREEFYFEDPNAPAPNVPLHPGASAVLFDDQDRVLVIKRSRGDYWSLPGGRIDPDEDAAGCCVRETEEETGLKTRVVRIVSINTSPRSVVAYPDGNVHRSFLICFEVELMEGTLRGSAESQGFRWLGRAELDAVKLIPDSRINALDAWERLPGAVIR